jgi:hypothetical protein
LLHSKINLGISTEKFVFFQKPGWSDWVLYVMYVLLETILLLTLYFCYWKMLREDFRTAD